MVKKIKLERKEIGKPVFIKGKQHLALKDVIKSKKGIRLSTMNKKEIKDIIYKLRKENDELIKKYHTFNVHISISLECISGEVMDVNPYGINLNTGIYFGRDLKDGKNKIVRFW